MKTIRRQIGPMITQQSFTCPSCRGKGKLISDENKCKKCHGHKIIKGTELIEISVPEGGKNGGSLLFEGTPEELINCKDSYTSPYLLEKLN